jgi:hypothetical protein
LLVALQLLLFLLLWLTFQLLLPSLLLLLSFPLLVFLHHLAVYLVPAVADFSSVGKRITQLDPATRKVAPHLTKSWLRALGP